MRTTTPTCLIFALLRSATAVAATQDAPDPMATDIRKAIEVLAADDMQGRGLGTEGLAKAADYIEAALRKAGLEPAFDGSFRQRFPVKTGVKLLEGNRLDGAAEGEFTPLPFSDSAEFSGELVFAGYGIQAPPIGYDDLEGLDLKGKVVLMMRYEPQEKDDASPFDGRKPSRWSATRYRVMKAREKGAAAVVFVTGPLQDEGQEKLPALKNDGPESNAGLPVLQVKTSVAARWLKPHGIDLKQVQEAIDRDLVARSRLLSGVRVAGRVALEATFAEADNVVGVLPGRGAAARQVVVLGAHYDHLGMGGQGSMRPNETAIHNGADDNASGTAVAMAAAGELARALAEARDRRTVVVALFAAEEVGLGGSSAFVASDRFDEKDVVAMVNLDMVGRYRDKLVALGAESAPEWKELIERLATTAKLEVTTRGDGYGPSDQTSFYAKGIPVLHFFTGAHEQYHTPEDDAASINADGAARIARLVASLVGEVSRGGVSPTYARAQAAPAMTGDSRGYGAYLGTIPDYSAMESEGGGVLLSDVRPGGPADRAGIKGKDRIVKMAGTRIENLYDMTYALQDHKPGDTVDVAVVRDGKDVVLRATLGDRATMGTPPAEPAKTTEGKAADAKGAEAKATEAKATPPHPTAPEPPAPGKGFYDDRPGEAFIVGAGKPFAGRFPEEKHLADVRQLTFGGENAEGYFAPDGRSIIFQATVPGAGCDQQYVIDLASGLVRRVSSGKGRTTCGYYDWPEADRIVYASTEAASAECPPPPDRSHGYAWPVYEGYDLWETRPDGSGARRLTETPGYDAEATWCHRGGKLVFTSMRDGDLDVYVMDEAGQVTRFTDVPGYDGGAFFSPDCREIVWRASRPQGEDLVRYRSLLDRGLVEPKSLELYVAKVDGSDIRQLTANGAANFCPTFHPDGKRIIYASNTGDSKGREFELWIVDKESGALERITHAPGFDGFPHWSADGRYLVWGSNRANPEGHDTNLFIARWVE